MKLTEFDYDLPKEYIAQSPIEPRDSSKLMVLFPDNTVEHRTFNEIGELLNPGDTIVMNDTKVIHARLEGKKPTGGKVEFLVLEKIGDDLYECLVKGKVREGIEVQLTDSKLEARMSKQLHEGRFEVEFQNGDLDEYIAEKGLVPLPPYYKGELADPNRYQTVYASREGSVTAPTAGLHFTPGLLETVRARGVKLAYITMHISYGTFSPIKTENVADHRMYEEYYKIDHGTAEVINGARKNGRLIAVGTSTVRTLETAADENGVMQACEGETDLYIYPGYEFKSGIDILITNLHLPKSTLILLVSAFAGKERIFDAYQEAIRQKYRFYSFGDAMFVYRQ